MAPTRKTVTRGGGEAAHDPERGNNTQIGSRRRAAERDVDGGASDDQGSEERPASIDPESIDPDPERDDSEAGADDERDPETRRRIRARTDLRNAALDPEVNKPTTARPAGKKARRSAGQDERENSGYRTGQNYRVGDDSSLSSDALLEGEGLDALDPEIGAHTKSLPAIDDADGPPDENEEDETEGGLAEPADDQAEADDSNATRAGPPLKIQIIGGPDTGKSKKFKGVRMVIGRTPGVDLLLSDQSVSRRHVELIYGDDGVMLRDLGSGNGTKVNGTKLAEKKLEHGDEIVIGKTKMRFVDELAAFKKAREEEEARAAAEKEAAEKPKDPAEGEVKTEGAEGNAETDAPKTNAENPIAGEAGEGEGEGRKRRVRPARTPGGAEGSFAAKFKALPKPVRLGIVGATAVLLLLMIVGIVLRPPQAPPASPERQTAETRMAEARAAAREGDYAKVVELVAEAERKAPGIDRTKLGQQAQEELGFLAKLEEARTAIGERRFDDARKALENTGKGSIKSEQQKSKVRGELEVAEQEYKKEKIDELLAAGEVEAAKSLLAELPIELQNEPASKVREFERELEEQRELEKKDAAAAARLAAFTKQQRREQQIIEAFGVVERKFASSEWDRASSECARVMDTYRGDKEIYDRARKLQGLIPSFGRNYDEGTKKYRQGAKASAAKPLRAAYSLYGQIGLRANAFGQELEDKIGESALIAGKEALLREDLITAWQLYRDAVRFDPGNAQARLGLEQVATKAQDLYESAYMMRDRDQREAVRKFRIVVQVTEAGSVTHEKAKNQLSALAP